MQNVLALLLAVMALALAEQNLDAFCDKFSNCKKCLYDGEGLCTWEYDEGERGSCFPDTLEGDDDAVDDDDDDDDVGETSRLRGRRGLDEGEDVELFDSRGEARSVCRERPTE